MKSYIMLTVELELEVIVIHRSTKNLKQIMTPEAIPCETVVMGTSAKIYIRASLHVKIEVALKQEMRTNI